MQKKTEPSCASLPESQSEQAFAIRTADDKESEFVRRLLQNLFVVEYDAAGMVVLKGCDAVLSELSDLFFLHELEMIEQAREQLKKRKLRARCRCRSGKCRAFFSGGTAEKQNVKPKKQ